MPGNGGGEAANGGTTTGAAGQGHQQRERGLDSGLAKSAPIAEGLNQKSYRSYRRRLQLFAKQCGRRGRDTAIEGTFLAVSLLYDAAWEAIEHLDLDEVELDDEPF